ncbi:UbiA family prenyltransferase [Streptomyces stramineus]
MTALAGTAGHSAGNCALLAAAVLSGQLSVGWCNDAFDARRDAAAGRSKPVATGAVSAQTVWAAAHTALALCVPLSLMCGPLAGAVHLAGVGAAWAYNLRLKVTVWSWLPYAAGFASLPAFVTLSLDTPCGPRGGWPWRVPCWVWAPIWPIRCRTSPEMWRWGRAACRTGWGRPGRAGCCRFPWWRRPRSWPSARRAVPRRGGGGTGDGDGDGAHRGGAEPDPSASALRRGRGGRGRVPGPAAGPGRRDRHLTGPDDRP